MSIPSEMAGEKRPRPPPPPGGEVEADFSGPFSQVLVLGFSRFHRAAEGGLILMDAQRPICVSGVPQAHPCYRACGPDHERSGLPLKHSFLNFSFSCF